MMKIRFLNYHLAPIRIALIALLVFQCGCYFYSTIQAPPLPPTDEEMRRLDPRSVIGLYWSAALTGDTEMIKRIVGQPGKSMTWDCPPKEIASNGKGVSFEASGPGLEVDFDKPVDNLESILFDSKVIKIDRKPLARDFDVVDYKSFGSEAKAVVRPKDGANSTNSRVFFLLRDGDRWRIVHVISESQLQFVGNKKFGEARDCPSIEQGGPAN